MSEQLSGVELRQRFFEVCWWWKWLREHLSCGRCIYHGRYDAEKNYQAIELPKVESDANCCEAWAMRWAREQGLLPQITIGPRGSRVIIFETTETLVIPRVVAECRGTDWKEAFVRACVKAGLVLQQAKGGA